METIVLPRLYCPFPSAINKHAESLHQQTLEWVRKFNLISDKAAYQRFCQSKFAQMSAYIYPEVTLTDLKLLSDWNVWLFILDDQFDEGGIGKQPMQLADLNTEVLNILREASTTHRLGPLGTALHDIRQRMIQQKPNAFLMNRFIRSVESCLASSVWEATNRARGITPDVATYMKMRTVTSGIPTIFDFILIAQRIDLPAEVLNCTDVQQLCLIANNAVCWANDIISFDKERRCGDVHNLVLTLRHEHQCTLEEAIQRAAKIHDDTVRTFIELETYIPSFGAAIDFDLQKYVSNLRGWIRGNFDWQGMSARYRLGEMVVV